jgi:Golgi phosphoprotein 3 (GPP34)
VLLAEEFVLLTLDDESGTKTLSGEKYAPALGAALLVELALRERISVSPQTAGWRHRGRVHISSTKPTDDSEVDAALRTVEQKDNIKIGSLIEVVQPADGAAKKAIASRAKELSKGDRGEAAVRAAALDELYAAIAVGAATAGGAGSSGS